jgi:hypothetical protein
MTASCRPSIPGRVTNPEMRFVGVSLNTGALSEIEANAALNSTSRLVQLSCVDPLRPGGKRPASTTGMKASLP